MDLTENVPEIGSKRLWDGTKYSLAFLNPKWMTADWCPWMFEKTVFGPAYLQERSFAPQGREYFRPQFYNITGYYQDSIV